MTKGKKQQTILEQLIAESPHPSITLGEEYSRVGLELQGECIRSNGEPIVLINPYVGARGPLRMSRTPIGAVAPTVLGALGLEDPLIDAILANASPRCGPCNRIAERSQGVQGCELPQSGYIALVVEGLEEDITLSEQCELLGAERAVVDGALLRPEDAKDARGEPVINLISAPLRDEISREVNLWFSRGGGTLRLVHFDSRGAIGREIAKVFRGWRCSGCGASLAELTRDFTEDAEACKRCRGEGWISVEDDRRVVCDDCDGFALNSPLGDYEFAGTKLRHVWSRSFRDVTARLRSLTHGISALDQARLETLCESGLADYPIGMPRDLLSKGERALLTLISAKLSGLSGATLAIDQGNLGIDSETLSAVLKGGMEPRALLVAPKWVGARSDNPALASDAEVTLRDVERGPLQVESLTFDIGSLVMIKGGIGTGKSLLLDEIQRRFAKRRKLGHLASFGGLKKSLLVRATDSPAGVVCELLGVDREIAAEAARTRQAQERGLSEVDFLLASSKHRCPGCKKGYNGSEGRCLECDGRLFDAHVATVLVNGVQYGDLMRQSLKEVSQSLWLNDVMTSLLRELPETLLGSLSLGTQVGECDPSIRRFLSVFAALHIARIGQSNVRNMLFLIDNPFGVAPSYQSLMVRCIQGLSRDGATIVCAGVPEALENIFSSVIRLSVVGDKKREGAPSRFFDTRMGRRVELCVDR